jgi:hypothetical protein
MSDVDELMNKAMVQISAAASNPPDSILVDPRLLEITKLQFENAELKAKIKRLQKKNKKLMEKNTELRQNESEK